MRFTSGSLAASAPSGERKRSRGNLPGKWNAKSWTARSACGNFVYAIERRKSPEPKGFPISLNGALIVIHRTREESEMAVALNCSNSVGRQFSIGKRRSDSRRSCFQYLLSILRLLLTRSLIQKFARGEVMARERKRSLNRVRNYKDVRVEKFAPIGRTWIHCSVDLLLICEIFNWYIT